MSTKKPRIRLVPTDSLPGVIRHLLVTLSLTSRAAAVLFWTAFFFLLLQVTLGLVIEFYRPELRDPEFGYKLVRLHKLLAQKPDRPLVLALGSSRTQLLFRPTFLTADCPEHAESFVAFNFGLVGAGPITEMICLRRLLDYGIRPDVVVLEVLPPLLHQRPGFSEESSINLNRLGWRDWARVRPYFTHSDRAYRKWICNQLVPCSANRSCLLSRVAPSWLPGPGRQDAWWYYTDAHGWMCYRDTATPAERRHGLEHAHREYSPALQRFCITAAPDRALRFTLQLCRQRGIAVVLVLTPESSTFRGWYPPDALSEIEQYLGRLTAYWSIPLVDARTWLEDADFLDGHHVLPGGADRFSARLGQEVLLPMLTASLGTPARCGSQQHEWETPP